MTIKESMGLIATGLLLTTICVVRSNQLAYLHTYGTQTVGTITAVGGNITVSFVANGTVHAYVLSKPYYTLYAGETYRLLYDPNDLTSTDMLFWDPVFDPQSCGTTVPTAIRETIEGHTVVFEYTVTGNHYKRFQDMKPNSEFTEGRVVKVLYKREAPHIAYVQYQRRKVNPLGVGSSSARVTV